MPQTNNAIITFRDGSTLVLTPPDAEGNRSEKQLEALKQNHVERERNPTDPGEIRCDCPSTEPGPRKLVNRKGETLATWPKSGPNHHPDCGFHKEPVEHSGLGSYSEGALLEGKTTIKVRLQLARRLDGPIPAPLSIKRGAANPRTSKRTAVHSMRTMGLLNFLWEDAKLNFHGYDPTPKTLTKARKLLLQAAQGIKWDNGILADNLVVMIPRGPRILREREVEQTHAVIERAIDAKERVIFIGELEDLHPAKFCEHRVTIRDSEETYGTTFYMPNDAVESYFAPRENHTEGLYRKHLDAGRDKLASRKAKGQALETKSIYFKTDPKLRSIALLFCNVARNKPGAQTKFKAKVELAGMMIVSEALIPVHSNFELQFEKHLRESGPPPQRGRRFVKPLRFDAEKEDVFPDFILTDVQPHHPIEVFCDRNERYLLRRREKEEYYNKYFPGGWSSWHADSLDEAPETLEQAAAKLPKRTLQWHPALIVSVESPVGLHRWELQTVPTSQPLFKSHRDFTTENECSDDIERTVKAWSHAAPSASTWLAEIQVVRDRIGALRQLEGTVGELFLR